MKMFFLTSVSYKDRFDWLVFNTGGWAGQPQGRGQALAGLDQQPQPGQVGTQHLEWLHKSQTAVTCDRFNINFFLLQHARTHDTHFLTTQSKITPRVKKFIFKQSAESTPTTPWLTISYQYEPLRKKNRELTTVQCPAGLALLLGGGVAGCFYPRHTVAGFRSGLNSLSGTRKM